MREILGLCRCQFLESNLGQSSSCSHGLSSDSSTRYLTAFGLFRYIHKHLQIVLICIYSSLLRCVLCIFFYSISRFIHRWSSDTAIVPCCDSRPSLGPIVPVGATFLDAFPLSSSFRRGYGFIQVIFAVNHSSPL